MRYQAVVASQNAVVRHYALCGAVFDVVNFHCACLIFPDAHRGTIQSETRGVSHLIQSVVIESRPHNVGGACDLGRDRGDQFLNQ